MGNTVTPGQYIGKTGDILAEAAILEMEVDRMNLKQRAALITGGSQGLGRALGEALAAAGARVALVALVARHGPPLHAAVAAIRARGGEAHAIVADVGELAAAHAIAGQAAALLGPVDILVNNASALGPVPLRLLLDTECEDLDRALAVNLVGPFRLIKAIGGSMLLRGSGTIVNVSSDAAVEAYERWGAYGASKAALDHLTRIWAAELAGTGVRIFSVDPGEMNTRLHADALPEADPASLADPARVAARVLALIADGGAAAGGTRVSIAAAPGAPSVGA
jgi:NAD(P)-dependent dehydrogenase (short-subunit alcohol dehydrogenase family)